MFLSQRRFSSTSSSFVQSKKSTLYEYFNIEVLPQGYKANTFTTPVKKPSHYDVNEQFAYDLACLGKHVFITGIEYSGKSRLLRSIGEHLVSELNKKVLFTGATFPSLLGVGGILFSHALGLRQVSGKVRRIQYEAMMERHVRYMSEKLYYALPTIKDVDVLIIDDFHTIPMVIMEALDVVNRRVRNRPDEPFGGLQIIVGGDYFNLPISREDGHTGFPFQHNLWQEMFPFENRVALLHPKDQYHNLCVKALFGQLNTKDIKELLACGQSPSPSIPVANYVDDRRAFYAVSPRFPKYTSSHRQHPRSSSFQSTDLGGFIHPITHSLLFHDVYGVLKHTTVNPGDPIQFLWGNNDGIAIGDIGRVEKVHDYSVEVTMLTGSQQGKVLFVPEMHVRLHHKDYPCSAQEASFAPYIPRKLIGTKMLGKFRVPTKYVNVDARWILEVNGLGQLLSRLHKPIINRDQLDEYLERENTVHEPTRVEFEQLFNVVFPKPLRYCKNCKSNIPSKDFGKQHWTECISSTRWCTQCDVGIPLNLWDSHAERHTMVRCFDCGKILQWRLWDTHRISCPGMLKEISPDNPFIPVETRSLSLASGHDRKDLHNKVEISHVS
eukprot:PhF_6_TR22509/c0_g1_i1/m.31926/K15255/PIF1; ATP-dependent DNA helicase PIF1